MAEVVSPSEERIKALKLAIDKIEKDFGKGAIMKLDDKPPFQRRQKTAHSGPGFAIIHSQVTGIL